MNNIPHSIPVNEILLRRRHKICIPLGSADAFNAENGRYVLAIQKNIESLGFTFSNQLIQNLMYYSPAELQMFYQDLLPVLKFLCGADVKYKPMYPNFPAQVAEASDLELFLNALLHYATFGQWSPEYQANDRMPLIDNPKLTVIELSPEEPDELMQIFTNLLASKTSLSSQDRQDVQSIILSRADYFMYLPPEIPLKENVAFVSKLIIEKAPIKSVESVQSYFSTATDVLRLITALSDGDISLAANVKFRSLKQEERRFIMDLLAGLRGNILEDLFRYRERWLRVAEILHVGEYSGKRKYSRVIKAFNSLRNEKKPLFFAGQVEEAIKSGRPNDAAKLLSKRPGEFARRLDKLLRDTNDPNEIVNAFAAVAENVSSTVLLQVRQHFRNRMVEDYAHRVFFPKGQIAKVKCIPNELPHLGMSVLNAISDVCDDALVKIYKNRPALGKVYISPEFKNFVVPFSQRSASPGTKNVIRGSRLAINPDAKVIRAFIWWTNTSNKDCGRNHWDCEGRVDIDLSACILDDEFKYVSHVSYTNLRDASAGAYHSGDITNGGPKDGNGVAEFIDIDIESAAEKGRYICFQMYNYTMQKYHDLPNCRFGWMERQDLNSGEIFEPSTVQMVIQPQTKATSCVPVLFDLVDRCFIWMDMNLNIERSWYGGNNLESNFSSVQGVCHSMVNVGKTNLYALVSLNAIARGKITADRDEADIIFDNDLTKPREKRLVEIREDGGELYTVAPKDTPIITAFDVDYYMGQML